MTGHRTAARPARRGAIPSHRLLAVDIDGTLLNSRDELTAATRAALHEAAAAGVRIVLATGRRFGRVLPLVEPLKLDAPLVLSSGALVKCPLSHETLYHAELSPTTVRQMLAIIAREGYEAVLYADTYAQGFEYYCTRVETGAPLLDEFLALNQPWERVQSDLMTNPPSAVFAAFAMGTRDDMLALSDVLQAGMPGQLATHVLRSPRYRGYMCEIARTDVSKWSAVARLAEEWAIARREICAVGDDVNDVPRIEAAGLGVAVGNALPEVKQAADLVVGRHDEDGLVDVIRHLIDGSDANA